MIALGSVALLRPFWLLALPAIAIGTFVLVARSGALRGWQKAIDPGLLAALTRRGAVVGAASRAGLPVVLTMALLALALSGPAVERKDADTFRNLDATLLVVDLSSAVGESGSLQHLRVAARSIAAAAGTRQVGMIVYAGDAYVASTLSTDEAPLDSAIFALESDTVPDRGNRPAKALALAGRLLKQAGILASDVVVVSAGDGFDAASVREASELAKQGHTVDALVVVPGDNKPVLPDRLAAMTRLADAGGGVLATSADPGALVDKISRRWIERFGSGEFALLVWRDFGRFLLLAAAVSALFLFHRQRA